MRNTVIALGFFDGVHRGHQKILNEAVCMAIKNNTHSAVVTFKNQPRAFLTGRSPNLLTNVSQREKYIRQIGIDEVYMLPFDAEMASMSPESFVRDILIRQYGCACVVCGQNYTFGAMGKGDGRLLEEMGSHLGFESYVCDPVLVDGMTVSSTWIRQLVSEGRIRQATKLLGHPYVIQGTVVHGRGVGTKLGFPTGNVTIPADMLMPKHGVYAAWIRTDRGAYRCALNIGVRPTFGLSETVAEFNILDFSGDLYGSDIELSLVDFIREERAFSSKEELTRQIAHDVGVIKELLK